MKVSCTVPTGMGWATTPSTRTSGAIASYRYTLDAVGNRLSVEENNGRRVDYTYDSLYRVVREAITNPDSSEQVIDYTYDPIGNRLEKDDSLAGVTTYTYDVNDRLIREISPAGLVEYAYDNNGNTLSRTSATEKVNYVWDSENRLIAVTTVDNNSTQQANYQYDTNGIRVAAIVDGIETRYLIDTNRPYAQVLEEYTPSGNLLINYVYGRDLISQTRDGIDSFYHVDGLGSTRLLTETSGQVIDTYTYDAYGNLLASTETTTNNYLFAGEQYDPAAQSYYLRARYYDTQTGRFTSRDLFDGFLIEPLSLAKYTYVHGNPVNGVDPSGLFFSVLTAPTVLNIAIGWILAVGSVFLLSQSLSSFGSLISSEQVSTIPEVANVTSTPVQLSTALSIVVAAEIVQDCAYWNDPNCFVGFPIQVYGAAAHEDHTNHIFEAQIGWGQTFSRENIGNPGFPDDFGFLGDPIPAFLSRGYNWPRTWLDGTSWCNTEARGRYLDTNSRIPACDEYPYASTIFGGFPFYLTNQVSVKLVDLQESNRQGEFIAQFYNIAGVDSTFGENSWFGVITIPDGYNQSFYITRTGLVENYVPGYNPNLRRR